MWTYSLGSSLTRHEVVPLRQCGTCSCRHKLAVDLSRDHKADDEMEVERIQTAGGTLFKSRLEGYLAVGRAFGDIGLKEFACKEVIHP